MGRNAEDWLATVDALLEGDQPAFRQLARLVTGYLARSRAYDFRDEWDDVVQEVILTTSRAVSEGRVNSSASVMGYVRNATHNRFVDWLRRRRIDSLDAVAEERGGELPWAAGSHSIEEEIAVRDELAKLPEKQRLALVAVYVEGRTYDEAASATGTPLGSLKRYLREGMARLEARLGDS